MIYHNIFAMMFVLILAYLLITNYQGTVQIISQLGGTLSNETATLQGRGSGTTGSTLTSLPSTSLIST
jgi:hypothetical protein